MSDVRTGQEQPREVVVREPPDQGMTDRRRGFLATGLALLAICVALFLVWQTASSLLIIFAGVLFAAFLDAAARALALIIPLNRVWRLTFVLLLFSTMVGLGLAWGGGKLPQQTRILLEVMDVQFDILQQRLLTYGVDLLGPESGRDFAQWLLSDQGRFFSHAQLVLGRASSFLTGVLVIAFLGILFAFDPTSHRESLVMLAKPPYRARIRAVMNEMGNVLRLWLVGQLIRIILMTLCVWVALYLIGLPGPFVLGLQAGLSNFVPYLGPILAAIPILLVLIEGYMIGPLIQRQAVEIPPAWTLVAIVLLGAMLGVMGIALAMPLVAVGRVAIIRFYVEDYLGDNSGRMSNKGPSQMGAP